MEKLVTIGPVWALMGQDRSARIAANRAPLLARCRQGLFRRDGRREPRRPRQRAQRRAPRGALARHPQLAQVGACARAWFQATFVSCDFSGQESDS